MSDFVHLHVHTEYSLADSTIRIRSLIAKALEYKMPALAITDASNIYGVIKFYKACLNAGIKPIIGADVWIENPLDSTKQDKFILLARNNKGYEQLCELLSHAILKNQHLGKAVISQKMLGQKSAQYIALHDSFEGELNTLIVNGELKVARQILSTYKDIFTDNLYIEIARLGHINETIYEKHLLPLTKELDLPLVAVNRVQFLESSDFDAHEVRVCIHDGRQLDDPRRTKKFTSNQSFTTREDMSLLFADIPSAIENTFKIAQRCNVFFNFDKDYLPKFSGADESSIAKMLQSDAQSGLKQRLKYVTFSNHDYSQQDYQDRLKLELEVITQMGFASYFLIVSDFINWSRQNNIPVGPGRGSGAGSVVAWSLKITDIDPLQYGLLFERFLNPERVSMPDFDIDFCMQGRDKVIEYVANLYGHEKVAQIITFGTMAAKAVIRDVGRVLGHPYGYVDSIAKLIPFEVGMTLEKAFDMEKALVERVNDDNEAAQLFDMARQLEGLSRNVGKHAGGVVIAPVELTHFTALYAESENTQAVTQLDKDDLEEIGLVKFDFLGLRTLTVIDWALAFINKLHEKSGCKPIELPQQAFDDQKTFDLIQQAKTVAIFQLESSGMRDLISRLKPDCFEDLIALVALFRPGPLDSGMVDSYVKRKHGLEGVIYPHPDTQKILEETYGVILYQEQVMQIAQVLAGYTLGGADVLRRAMGKKKVEEMAEQRNIFVVGAQQNNIDTRTAEHIFDMMETFAGYGFNKSHSAAYALLSFQTAWLKAHYPAAFMAAALSADMDNTDKIVGLIADLRLMQLNLKSPDINQSELQFEPLDDSTILYGLGAIKGLGESAIQEIIKARDAKGAFVNIYDFCERVVSQKVNKRALEALVRCGAFDRLEKNRAQVLAELPTAIIIAEQNHKNKSNGQSDLFGVRKDTQTRTAKKVIAWNELRHLSEERESLGLYLSGHPFDYYRPELESFSDMSRFNQPDKSLTKAVVAGMIVDLRVINSRSGKIAFISLDDGIRRVEVNIFSTLFALCHDLIRKDNILIVTGERQRNPEKQRNELVALSVTSIDQLRFDALITLQLNLSAKQLDQEKLNSLQTILSQHIKDGRVSLELKIHQENGTYGLMRLGEKWEIKICNAVIDEITTLFGQNVLSYIYDRGKVRDGTGFVAPINVRRYAKAG